MEESTWVLRTTTVLKRNRGKMAAVAVGKEEGTPLHWHAATEDGEEDLNKSRGSGTRTEGWSLELLATGLGDSLDTRVKR